MEVQVRRFSDDTTIAERVRVADRVWSRARGLLGFPALQPGEGLLLSPCRAVHTLGMRQSLDVVFLDEAGVVLAEYRELAPNRRTRWHRRAACALELAPGTLERTRVTPGARLSWRPRKVRQ
jgi:uncharacterized protein